MLLRSSLFILLLLSAFFSCKKDRHEPDPETESGYPPPIANIISNKCANAGCHNDISRAAAGGLSLETWERMFEGSNGGAAVIPYRPDYSTLMYYVNHDSILPYPQLVPLMPVNEAPLSQQELETLRDWIAAGAPDKNGFVKFSDNPSRHKFYVSNQGCDAVTVFDASTMLAMRVKDVGKIPLIESPHLIKISNDNQFWYVCFLGGSFFQKYSTTDNSFIAEAPVGAGSWNTFCISSNDSIAYLTDFSNGKVAIVDLATMTVQFKTGFGNPHGIWLNESDDTLYITAQLESSVFKVPVNDFTNYEVIDLIQQFPSPAAELEPHEVAVSPDGLHYYVTCQESNDLRVVQVSNDSVVKVIPMGLYPVEMAFSETHPYLFVTCLDALNTNPQERGTVAVVNYSTNTFIKNIYSGYQPHGIAVDDVNGRVYIANRNLSQNGPAPHHASLCNGRNGYVSVIDLSTLQLIPSLTTEVSVDPYSIGIMH